MHRFFIICFLLIPFVAFGEIKKITKTEKVVVPHNQSVEQVLNYTSEKLARIAAEEAGVAISLKMKSKCRQVLLLKKKRNF